MMYHAATAAIKAAPVTPTPTPNPSVACALSPDPPLLEGSEGGVYKVLTEDVGDVDDRDVVDDANNDGDVEADEGSINSPY